MPDPAAPDGRSESLSDRVFAVLSAFVEAAPALGVTDIHRITGLDKSVVHRIVRGAVARGFLQQDPETRRYSVGLRAWELGRQYEGADRVVERATPVLEELSKTHDVTSYLGELDGLDVVYLALIESPGPIRIVNEVGGRIPATTSALGKALLARLDPSELRRRLAGWATEARRELLTREIAEVRESGIAVNRGELITGVGAVGAVVPASGAGGPIAVSAAFLMLDANDTLWETLPPAVAETADRVAARLDAD